MKMEIAKSMFGVGGPDGYQSKQFKREFCYLTSLRRFFWLQKTKARMTKESLPNNLLEKISGLRSQNTASLFLSRAAECSVKAPFATY